MRAVDERGDPIPDYNLQLFKRGAGASGDNNIHQFDLDVHTYGGDPSLRCSREAGGPRLQEAAEPVECE